MIKMLKLFISGKLIWKVVFTSSIITILLTLWAMNIDVEAKESVQQLSFILTGIITFLLFSFYYAVIFGYWVKFLSEKASACNLILGYAGSTILLVISLSAYFVVFDNMVVPDVYMFVVKNWFFWFEMNPIISFVSASTFTLFLAPLSSKLKKYLRGKLRDFSNEMEKKC